MDRWIEAAEARRVSRIALEMRAQPSTAAQPGLLITKFRLLMKSTVRTAPRLAPRHAVGRLGGRPA
jgi:hypothetical protein